MKPALTALFCWLITAFGLRAQVIGKPPPTGNFMLVEERVKAVSATEYRSAVVVMVPADTSPPVPVQRFKMTVIPAKPDWPDPEPIIDEQSGPYFILMGFPQPGGKLIPGRLGANIPLNRNQ